MQTGNVYKLTDNTTGKFYIGSTKHSVERRKGDHERAYRCYVNGKHNYTVSFDIIKDGNYMIELLEEVKYNDISELRAREQHYINSMENCINKVAAHISKEERKKINHEFYLKNKPKIQEYYKSKVLCPTCNKEFVQCHIKNHKCGRVNKPKTLTCEKCGVEHSRYYVHKCKIIPEERIKANEYQKQYRENKKLIEDRDNLNEYD